MLSKTTLSALRALLYIAQHSPTLMPPRRIASALGESPTYLSKVTTQLAKARLVRSERGAKGGVQLARPASEITLLAVVEACQGTVVGSYCRANCEPASVCAFHVAAEELERSVVGTLERWTLQSLLSRPRAAGAESDGFPCMMLGPSEVVVRKPKKKRVRK